MYEKQYTDIHQLKNSTQNRKSNDEQAQPARKERRAIWQDRFTTLLGLSAFHPYSGRAPDRCCHLSGFIHPTRCSSGADVLPDPGHAERQPSLFYGMAAPQTNPSRNIRGKHFYQGYSDRPGFPRFPARCTGCVPGLSLGLDQFACPQTIPSSPTILVCPPAITYYSANSPLYPSRFCWNSAGRGTTLLFL